MSAANIVNAAAAVVQQAVPDLTVVVGEPFSINDSPFLFLYHKEYGPDVKKATGQNTQRHHLIRLALLVRAAADPDQAEQDFMDYSDAITDVWYKNHTLQQTAADCQIHPEPGAAPYIEFKGAVYRVRRWTLDAWEYITYGQG